MLEKMSQPRRIAHFIALLPSLLSHAEKTGGNLSNCKGGCDLGELCVGNSYSQPEVTDSECNSCAGSRYWWPCNFETLCHCNDPEGPRVPPAPRSGTSVNADLDPCMNILTEDIFNSIVQPTSEEGRNLYTYSGLCAAISLYNAYQNEKFANMGDEMQMRAELAAFLAHTAVDTHGYSVTREDMHCVDPIKGADGKMYCKPCKEQFYDAQSKTCSQNFFSADELSYKEYCDTGRQVPSGCACSKESVTPVNVPLAVSDAGNIDTSGYIAASDAYFVRGALQISWNYDYYGASMAMGGGNTQLCDNPDLVSTDPQMAWGVGLFKWMEKMQHGTTGSTAHKQIMKNNFGGTVKVLYGPLECPSNDWSSQIHVDMVKDRVAQVCKAGAALGVMLEMDECDTHGTCLKCKGLKEIFESCQLDGSCPDCPTWPDFVRSESPTVTPLRIDSPSWEDWSSEYGKRSSAGYDVGGLSVVYFMVSLVGFLFAVV